MLKKATGRGSPATSCCNKAPMASANTSVDSTVGTWGTGYVRLALDSQEEALSILLPGQGLGGVFGAIKEVIQRGKEGSGQVMNQW